MKYINIIHSFPENNHKFKSFCDLTFEINTLQNTYVSNLNDVNDVNKYDIVVIHYLRFEDCRFLSNHDINKPVIWFCWGADIFSQGKFYNKFLLAKTKLLRRNLSFKLGLISGIKQIIKEKTPLSIDCTQISKNKFETINDKIDYCVPVMPGDFELIKKNYKLNCKLFHLNYVNPLIQNNSFEEVSGNNILLGNSSSFTNNHLEAIDQLSKIDLKSSLVIIPLSYGDKHLATFVADYARKKLGENKVEILDKFITSSDYNNILQSCEIMIFNHLRQQAVGNVIQCLLNGSHLYLRKESTVYQFLKHHNFVISALNNIRELKRLGKNDIDYNRKKALEVFGAKSQHKKIASLIEEVMKHNQ